MRQLPAACPCSIPHPKELLRLHRAMPVMPQLVAFRHGKIMQRKAQALADRERARAEAQQIAEERESFEGLRNGPCGLLVKLNHGRCSITGEAAALRAREARQVELAQQREAFLASMKDVTIPDVDLVGGSSDAATSEDDDWLGGEAGGSEEDGDWLAA